MADEEAMATSDDIANTLSDVLAGYACSFTPATVVTTSHGKQAIGTIQVGEKVLAYNLQSKDA